MSITFSNTVFQTGFVGEDDGAPTSATSLDTISTNSITVNGVITNVGDPVTVTGLLPDSSESGDTSTTNTLYVTAFDNSGMIEFSSNPPNNQANNATPAPYRYFLSNTALMARQRVTLSSDPALSQYQPVCFASGTLIRTLRGDVAVEDLGVGDLAITASGAERAIGWIGHRTIECRRHPRPHVVNPVRIAADAFGPSKPARDLLVSPGHAVCVDVIGEVLIPASALVNGSTIAQVEVDTVTYWHVELECGHDILVANGLPCESYLDMGNRGFFSDSDALVLHAGPDASAATHADFCRPLHCDGPVVAFVRERLASRAATFGWTLVDAPVADLHLVVDGRRIEPDLAGLSARFVMPAGAQDVWLVSDAAVPAAVGVSADLRAVGVCVGAMVIDDGFGEPRSINADNPALTVGFHDVESGPQRWTCGRAHLPARLWDGCRGTFFLRVDLTRPSLPRWVAPFEDEGKLNKGAIAA